MSQKREMARPVQKERVSTVDARRPMLQRRLSIGSIDDPLEREADRAAEAVLAGTPTPMMGGRSKRDGVPPVRRSSLAGVPSPLAHDFGTLPVQPPGAEARASQPGPPRSTVGSLDAQVAHALSSGGDALPSPLQQLYGRRLGYDFGSIRVHTGAQAVRSAHNLEARAYTLGDHVVFGAGEYQPGSRDGRRLLLHELAHVVQQGAGRSSGRILRTPAGASPTASAPAGPSFRELWREFSMERMFRTARARELAMQALDLMTDLDDRVAHGLELATFFLDEGMADEARRTLDITRDAWMIAHVTAEHDPGLPRLAGLGAPSGGPEQLIAYAEAAARADRHEEAFRLFGTAYQLLSWQLDAEGPARSEELSPEGGGRGPAADVTRIMFHYPLVQGAYDQLRRILGFYRTLETEQRRAGDDRRAAYYSGLSLLLYREIRESYVWEADSGMIAEVQRVTTPSGGESLRLFGANLKSTDLTQLPGLPPPREVVGQDEYSFQHQSMTGITDALFAQTELMAELQGEAAIQAEFGTAAVDMNDLHHRLRVWRAMYHEYQQRDTLGLGALRSLMDLIGRYLRAYTIHTSYNIADFGESYLADNMSHLPVDLAGRLERDCGVYALTVAYEVFRTAREASPRLPLEFRLFAMPAHVTLVILDHSQNEHYVVNNDSVSPPRHGDVMEDVARAYAPIVGHRDLVTPAMEIGLGSTASSDRRFRSEAWAAYRDSASWGPQQPPPQPGETEAQQHERGYREFYAAQRFYAEESPTLDSLVSRLSTAIASLSPVERQARLEADVPAIRELAVRVGLAFERAGPFAPLDTSRPDPRLQRRLREGQRFLFLSAGDSCAPALARAAMVLMHFDDAGGRSTELDRAIIALCERVPLFNGMLQGYRAAGFPLTFCER